MKNEISSTQVQLQHSLLKGETFLHLLESNYHLNSPQCSFLHHGFNDTYFVQTSDKSYILRLYRYQWRKKEEIEGELQLLRYLAENKIPVSSGVPQLDGSLLFSVSAPEGQRFGALFTFATGNIPLQLTKSKLIKLAQLLANIHQRLALSNKKFRRPTLNLNYFWKTPIHILQTNFSSETETLATLEKKFQPFLTNLSQFLARVPKNSLIHGDFLRVNFFEKEEFTLFDFDFCGYGPKIYDLATFKWSLLETEENPEQQFEIFLGQYLKDITLAEDELKQLDLFVALRQLWVWTTNIAYGEEFRRLNILNFNHNYQKTISLLDKVFA